MKEQLLKLKNEYHDIAAAWDGDKPGIAEDRAHCAEEGIRAIDALLEAMDGLEINF